MTLLQVKAVKLKQEGYIFYDFSSKTTLQIIGFGLVADDSYTHRN